MRIGDNEDSRFSIGTVISIDCLFSIKSFICFVALFILLLLQTGPIRMLINEKNQWHTFAYIAFISGAFMYTGMTVYQMYDGGEKGRSSIPWISVIASILFRLHLHDLLQKVCFIICIIGYLYLIVYGVIPLIFDLIVYLLLMQTSLTDGQIKCIMLFTGMVISVIVGIIWVKTAYHRKFWFKEGVRKIIETVKKANHWISQEDDINLPIPDIITRDIARFREKINIKPYCESLAQKRKCMLAIIIISIVIKMLLHHDIAVIKIISGIPYWDFADFLHEANGDNAATAFWFYTIGAAGLAALMISLIQIFLIGEEKVKFLSFDGICLWLMEVYVIGLCSDICYPLALMCAKEKFFASNMVVNIWGIFAGFALFLCFRKV